MLYSIQIFWRLHTLQGIEIVGYLVAQLDLVLFTRRRFRCLTSLLAVYTLVLFCACVPGPVDDNDAHAPMKFVEIYAYIASRAYKGWGREGGVEKGGQSKNSIAAFYA